MLSTFHTLLEDMWISSELALQTSADSIQMAHLVLAAKTASPCE